LALRIEKKGTKREIMKEIVIVKTSEAPKQAAAKSDK
jgi:hypothetical protein